MLAGVNRPENVVHVEQWATAKDECFCGLRQRKSATPISHKDAAQVQASAVIHQGDQGFDNSQWQ